MLHIQVLDSGPGIAPEEQARIFERFARGSEGQMHNTPGTGLGLAITRELAGLMGGSLTLESDLGKGSRFTFSVRCALPVGVHDTEVFPDGENAENPRQERSVVPETAPKALRIVLAEDNKVSAHFLTEVLRQAGHIVAPAGDGFEALALLRKNPADLAILDIHMPGMSGLQLVERIRSGEAGVDPTLPIVSITASRSEEVQTRLRQLGVRLQAEKPLSAQRLLQLTSSAYMSDEKQSASPEMKQVFDLDAALEKVDGKRALLCKLVAVLLEELPQKEQALTQAIELDNPVQVHYLAHALKNSAAMLHLQQVQTAAATLEKAAHERQDCRPAWRALQEALPAAQTALRSYVNKAMDAI
jgi:CheY-like chemotaxis protein